MYVSRLFGVAFLAVCMFSLGAGCAPEASLPAELSGPMSSETVPVFMRSGPLGLGIDRSRITPLTARGRCMDLITECHSATDEAQDVCVDHLPACQTERPWEESTHCCPSACIDLYVNERSRGATRKEATENSFLTGACYPGVEAMIRGEAWE